MVDVCAMRKEELDECVVAVGSSIVDWRALTLNVVSASRFFAKELSKIRFQSIINSPLSVSSCKTSAPASISVPAIHTN